MASQDDQSICYLCGQPIEDDVTADHVPPKQFFPKALRDREDLLTLPTHRRCEASYGKDEEYVLHALAATALKGPVGGELGQDISRAYHRPSGKGMSLYHKVHDEFELRPGGIYLPRGLVCKTFDGARVHRVMWKIIRGLFYHHYGRVLPEYTPQDFGVYGRPEDVNGRFREAVDLPLKVRGSQQDCFAYRFLHVNEEDMNFHYWDVLLWQSVLCVLPFHDPGCVCETCGEARIAAGQEQGG